MKAIKKSLMLSVVVLAATGITACSTLKTTVIPQSQNKYTVVATAEKQSTAIDGAIKKAQKVCAAKGEKLIVVSHHTKYQGAGKTLGQVTKMASDVAIFDAGEFMPSSRSDEDYKSTVVFSCQ
jgi:hypothetical protein